MKIIEAKNIHKSYRKEKWGKTVTENHVLRGIDLSVSEGEIYGLLGLNGAGKTTLIRILSGILAYDEGHLEVLGKNYKDDESFIKKNIGVVIGGDRSLYWKLSAKENLEFFGTLYGMSAQVISSRVKTYLEYVNLYDRQNDLVETYSKGMKQRLLIAKALMIEPRFLILDEPTVGLDIQVAHDFRELLKALNRDFKMSMLLTTHYLSEAEALCDRIGFLKNGRIIQEGSLKELRAAFPFDTQLMFEIEGSLPSLVEEKLIHFGSLAEPLIRGDRTAHKLSLSTKGNCLKVMEVLNQSGIQVHSFEQKEVSLEDLISVHY